MKRKERFIILLFVVLAVFAFFFGKSLYLHREKILVKNASGEILLETTLAQEGIYTIEGKTGLFHLEVKDGAYRAVNVECPNHDCEAVGWVSPAQYRPIICLPNGIYVELVK